MAKRKTTPAASQQPSNDPAPPQPEATEPDPELAQARTQVVAALCPGCGQASTRIVFRVRKEGPNRGRLFAKCTHCQRFDWLTDAPATTAPAAPVAAPSGDAERDALQARATPCPKCGQPRRAQRVGKKGANHGRLFLTCSDRTCDSFEWAETNPRAVPGAGPPGKEDTSEAGLLRAIREAPDDDAPRLVYADWLDEHDEPQRAELIRVQCELARIPLGLRAAQLRQREQELLDRHAADWAAPLSVLVSSYTFRRGLLEHVQITPDIFAQCADELFRAAPLRALTVDSNYGAPTLRKLTRCQHLLHVAELTLTGQCHRSGLKVLVESPNVANLTHLALPYQDLSRPAVQDLASSRYLARLTHLNLHGNWIAPAGLAALGASPHLANLTAIDVGGNTFSDEDAQAWARSPHLTKLTHLVLWLCVHRGRSALTPAGLAELLHSANLARLTSLHLGDYGGALDGAALQVLAESPVLARLTSLRVEGSQRAQGVSDWVATVLPCSAAAANLTSLSLRGCRITADGARALASSPHLANLTSLDLALNAIGDEGARALAESRRLKHLASLDLSGCGLGFQGAQALAASPNLPDHLILNVADNRFGKEGERALGRFVPREPGKKK
jgi:uncharacterized protein (TIGR02996 family)